MRCRLKAGLSDSRTESVAGEGQLLAVSLTIFIPLSFGDGHAVGCSGPVSEAGRPSRSRSVPPRPDSQDLDGYDFEFLAVNLVAWFAIHDAARRMREARHLGLSPLAYIPFHQVAAMLEVPSADLNAYKGGRRYLRTEHLLQFMGQHRFGEQLFEYAASRNLLYKSAAFSWGGEFGAFEEIEQSRKVFLREVKTMKIEHQEEQLRRLSSSIRDLVRLAVDVEGEVVRAGGRATPFHFAEIERALSRQAGERLVQSLRDDRPFWKKVLSLVTEEPVRTADIHKALREADVSYDKAHVSKVLHKLSTGPKPQIGKLSRAVYYLLPNDNT